MVTSVQCRCGRQLQLENGQSQVTCPSCQKRFRVSERQTPRDVFLSYSSNDKPVAEAACAVLEQQGIRCWMAPRDILPGTEWSAAIIDGIEQTRLMVLLYSQHSNQSPQVLREVERAVSKGMPIIPLRLESTALSKSLEYFISSQHWLDALTPPLEQHLEALAGTVRGLLKRPPTAPKPDEASKTESLSGASTVGMPLVRSRRWTTALSAAGLLLMVGLSVVWYRMLFPAGEARTQQPSAGPAPVQDPPSAADERDPAYSAEIARRFALFDVNSDGIVSSREFYQAGRDRRANFNMVSNLFEFLDADKNRELTRDEVLSMSDRVMEMLDENHSGTLSQYELLQFPPTRQNKDGPKIVREIIKRFDYTHDGELDIREVERFIVSPPPG